MPEQPATPIRLSVSEASRLFGVTTKTIRRALTDGTITYIVVRGRYKISFESLVRWSQERPKIKNKLAQNGIGQYVGQWKIRNRLYSPNPSAIHPKPDTSNENSLGNHPLNPRRDTSTSGTREQHS